LRIFFLGPTANCLCSSSSIASLISSDISSDGLIQNILYGRTTSTAPSPGITAFLTVSPSQLASSAIIVVTGIVVRRDCCVFDTLVSLTFHLYLTSDTSYTTDLLPSLFANGNVAVSSGPELTFQPTVQKKITENIFLEHFCYFSEKMDIYKLHFLRGQLFLGHPLY